MLFTKQHLGIPVTQLSHHVIRLVTRTQANHSCHLIVFTLRDVKTHLHFCITYEETYVCRKGFPSINVQVVCNHNLLLMDVLVKWPRLTHDTAIWTTWMAHRRIWVPTETLYDGTTGRSNSSLTKWRNTIERTPGVYVLKSRFRALERKCGETAVYIIMAYCVLNNYFRATEYGLWNLWRHCQKYCWR